MPSTRSRVVCHHGDFTEGRHRKCDNPRVVVSRTMLPITLVPQKIASHPLHPVENAAEKNRMDFSLFLRRSLNIAEPLTTAMKNHSKARIALERRSVISVSSIQRTGN